MNAKTKDEVIRHLAGLLHEAGYVDDLEGYIKDVYLRESEGITGIGGHVAIPHGKSDYVDKVGIAVGRTHDMVEWSHPSYSSCLQYHLTAKAQKIICV